MLYSLVFEVSSEMADIKMQQIQEKLEAYRRRKQAEEEAKKPKVEAAPAPEDDVSFENYMQTFRKSSNHFRYLNPKNPASINLIILQLIC